MRRVPVVCGYTLVAPPSDAEIFDPATGVVTQVDGMTRPCGLGSATALTNGEALSFSASGAELYDPGAGTFSPTSPPRWSADLGSATRLQDGRVLVTGGWAGGATATAELWEARP